MQFDIIIGNPPYQQDTAGHGAQAKPVYQHFVRLAKQFNPKYLSLIIPARWYTGGMGLNAFRKEMINDGRIRVLHDYPNSKDCFPDVDIKGGVCYFLWDREHRGKCGIVTHTNGELRESQRMLCSPFSDTFIRYSEQLSIAEKVWQAGRNSSISFSTLVSSVNPFGLATDFFQSPSKYDLPSVSHTKIDEGLIIYGLGKKKRREKRYVAADYPLPCGGEHIGKWKVFVPEAGDKGGENDVLGHPFLGEPNSLCTFTYLNIGGFATRNDAEHCLGYMKTKFFRFLVGIIKTTQHATQRVYQLVPLQDWSEPWTDAKLYARYGLSSPEIAFIEKMIREMS